MRDLVIRCHRLAGVLDGIVQAADDLELLAPTSLSIVNFRYLPPGQTLADAELDDLNRRISAAIGQSGEAHAPTTRVNGRVSLRACILHHDNDEDDMEHLAALVRRFGAQLCGQE